MQIALNTPASARVHFASGRDYMMRSEKRPDPLRNSAQNGKKPPRRRRKKRAGFFYMLLMTLLLLTLWPLGLVMLWRRKVRWGALTKLLTSIVTLAACVILIGFALTVNTGNPRYTAMQDNVNTFLDNAADTLLNAGGIASEYAAEMADDMENVADALWERGKVYLANGIDAGITITQQAKNGVLELVEKLQSESAPEVSPETTTQDTATPEAQQSTPEASVSATETASVAPTDAPTDVPSEAPTESSSAEATDTATAEAPTNTQAIEASAPAAEQTPTSAPAPQTVSPATPLKSAALATVYHSTDGKYYHSFNRCSGMTGGGAYSLEECIESYKQCRACGAPSSELIGKNCLWMDARKVCHTSDECSGFEGKYTLIERDEALAQGLTGCEKCGGSEYLMPNTILDAPAQTSVPETETTTN